VISAQDVQSVEARFRCGMGMLLYHINRFCKYNMLGMHLDSNFQDLITNQKGLPFGATAMTT